MSKVKDLHFRLYMSRSDMFSLFMFPLCTVLYCTYCTVLYCTVLYCTVLYCTVLYCTVLYFSHSLFPTCTLYMSTVNVPSLSYILCIFLLNINVCYILHKLRWAVSIGFISSKGRQFNLSLNVKIASEKKLFQFYTPPLPQLSHSPHPHSWFP